MKRIDFIKGLMAIGGLPFISQKWLETKEYQKFYLLQSFIRGFKYYEGPSLIHQMKDGDLLELVREPGNEYDPCAIALHWNKKKIGFIPAEDNEMLSKLLDIGVPELVAEIVHLEPQAAAWENVNIAIYVLKEIPSNEKIPSAAAYLTELETPRYRTLKRANNTVTRVFVDEQTGRQEIRIIDAKTFLLSLIPDEKIKKEVETALDPSARYGEQADFLVVNKKRLPNIPGLKEQVEALQSAIYNAENMFDEDGYVVLAVDKADVLVGKINGVVNVADKLGRKFLELKL